MNEPFLEQAAAACDRYVTFLQRAVDTWRRRHGSGYVTRVARSVSSRVTTPRHRRENLRRMRFLTSVAALAITALPGCSGVASLPDRPATEFRPTVLHPEGTGGNVGAYLCIEAAFQGGQPVAGGEVLALALPLPSSEDLLMFDGCLERPASGLPSGGTFFNTMDRPPGEVIERTRTRGDGSGSVGLPVGVYACAYVYTGDHAGAGGGYGSSLITRPENVFGYRVRLFPAVPVSGYVKWRDGRPAAGAVVRAGVAPAVPNARLVLMTRCDEDGGFALPPVPLGAPGWGSSLTLRADSPEGAHVRREFREADLRGGPVQLTIGR